MSGSPDSSTGSEQHGYSDIERSSDPPDAEDLLDDLHDLAKRTKLDHVDDDIRETMELIIEASKRGFIKSGVRTLGLRDVAQAFVGSIIFASPLLVEDGIFDIGDYLFEFTVKGIPVFLIANTLFVILMTYALLEWTGRETREESQIFGIVPTRLIMVLGVSLIVATILMTVWGRVGDWNPPLEAIARINVLWTVGSLGAALGDVISGDSSSTSKTEKDKAHRIMEKIESSEIEEFGELVDESMSDAVLFDRLNDNLETLMEVTEDKREGEAIHRDVLHAREDAVGERFGEEIQKYTNRDIAEAFVGSIFFSIPFLVEDGVFDVADHFLAYKVGRFPIFFIFNAVFVLAMIWALVYWAGPQKVKVSRPILGFIPRRMVGISIVSFVTAGALMTMWGRVGNWEDPTVAVARISAVWTVASFGAALGDILPGESSGDDINDDLVDIGERVNEIIEGSS